MLDISCLLAGLVRLLGPVAFLIIWHKKTGARFFPAPVAFAVCIPVFIVGGAIRTGFSHSDFYTYYILQGLLYGILEEGAKFLMLKYFLTAYSECKDAVTYNIGHSAFEASGGGIACLALIGSGRAASDILFVNTFTTVEEAFSCVAIGAIIYYGIYTGKSIVTMPAVIFLHAFSSFAGGILMFNTPVLAVVLTLLTAGKCYAGYRCWKAVKSDYGYF